MAKDPQLQRWESERVEPALRRFPERREHFETQSGVTQERLYAPPEVDAAYAEKLGFPGEPPFTRGVQPTMYRGRFWTMRQYAGFGTAEESNARYKYLLEQGTTGLSVAFDLPTQMGRDSDDAASVGEVGRVGVAIDSLADMETLFDGIPLDQVSTSMTINATASTLLCLYVAVAKRQGVSADQLRGTVQNDILKEYIARGTYIYPPGPSMRIITDMFAWASRELPRFNTISISGYHIREAGSTAAQEIAFTLADGIAYVESALAAGLDVDVFAPRLSFFFNVHNDFIEEVAKFRAARRMWARIMKERFGAKKDKSMALRFHAQTAGSSLQAQQIDVNVVRVTLQTLAAVMGGAQSLHTNGKDEALSLPTEAAARLALRTQQVVAHESGVANVVDPLGGSWAIEEMTDALESRATEYITRIDEIGGMVNAIESGFPQKEILDAAYAWQKQVEAEDQIIVGVNRFQTADAQAPEILRIDPESEARQVTKTRDVRASRDAAKADACLRALGEAAQSDTNLMPVILDAVEAWCTVGEISDALATQFGRHIEKVVL